MEQRTHETNPHTTSARLPRALLLLLLAGSLLATSCRVNGYRKFYGPYLDAEDPDGAPRVVALAEGATPEIVKPADAGRYVRELMADNYVVLGHSSFVGPLCRESQLRAQGERVGATHVVMQVASEGSRTVELDLPTTTTSMTTGTVVSGNQVGSFSATTTSLDSEPFHFRVHRYTQRAWFLARSTTRPRVGLNLRSLSEADRKASGRNTGAVVHVVINDSPAFASHVVPGDVIVAIDGEPVSDGPEAIAALRRIPADAATCAITVVRGGEEVELPVTGI